MRIVVDVSPLSAPRTGIGNYILGMLRGTVEAAGPEDSVVAFAMAGPRGAGRIREALAGVDAEQRIVVVPPTSQTWRTLWSRLGRPVVERFAGELDVFHFSDWMYPAQRSGLRSTMIHDLAPMRFPDSVAPLTRRMHGRKYRNAAETCDLVFVNSEYTANDAAELLPIPRERVHVAYPGVGEGFTPEGDRSNLGSPYVLAVATLEPRKNVARLVEAFELLRGERPDLDLVVVGAEVTWAPSPLAGTSVRGLGFVPDTELPALYRGASAFVYPSLFEGFGIPIVEAMACGTPVVASAHPSMDEAAGEAAVRVDPESSEVIAEGIRKALDERESLVPKGLEHAKRFTWQACGEAHLHGFRTAS
jgi:glycosyltransferase involved in cell wall biosynthesis